ncbi:unnamed protein product [Rotaria socialis]
MWTCSITTKTKTTELISNAHTIVRARVIGYENPPAEPNHRYMGIPESVIKFEIEEQIKGAEILPNILWVNGYLSNNDDYNDHPPPYRRVRPNGRTGSCIANTYKQGAEYLLFLNDRYSPYWDALTPVNEQLHSPSSEDRWLRWKHMAAATAERTVCGKCSKAKGISKCEGCSQIFCYNDFIEHRHDLNRQLDEIVINHDIFQQDLTEHKVEPKNKALHQQINDWECDAIEKIRQTAEEARQILVKRSNDNTICIETKFSKLTGQLRRGRQENDFDETDLSPWKRQLIQSTEEINNASNIAIRQTSTTLVNKISVEILTWIAMNEDKYLYVSDCERNEVKRWLVGEKSETIVVGGRGQGNGLNQFNSPSCIFVDQDYSVCISDEKNHRIMKWIKDATEGIIVAGGQGEGNDLARLSCPRGVIVDPFDTVYVADTKNNRIVRWSKEAEDGAVVDGGNNQGSQQAQLYSPQGLSFDQQGNLYVTDRLNNRIQKFDIVPNSSSQ